VALTSSSRLLTVPLTNPGGLADFTATAVGDVNGDGLDDLLLGVKAEGTDLPTEHHLFLGRTAAAGPLSLSQADAVFQGSAFDHPFALGDLNRDGYDDFAIGSDKETEASGSLLVYYGRASYATKTFGASTAEFRVSRLAPGELGGGATVEGVVYATAGDFDGDGEMDLAVGDPFQRRLGGDKAVVDLQSRGTVSIFWSIVDRHLPGTAQTRLVLSQADVIIQGEHNGDQLGFLPATPALDLDRDGLADLLAGAPSATVLGTQLFDAGGRVYVLYGARTPDPAEVARLGGATTLSNRPVTGSGDFLVARSDGQPEHFGGQDIDGDGTDDFRLPVGVAERWFGFTTLGDGQPGDQLVIDPIFERRSAHVTATQIGSINSAAAVTIGTATVDRRTTSDSIGVVEVDLASLLGEEPHLARAELTVDVSTRAQLPTDPNTQPSFVQVGGDFYFQRLDPIGVSELLRSDGTVLGTVRVTVTDPLGRAVEGFRDLVDVNGTLFFTAVGSGNDRELYRINPSTRVGERVADVDPAGSSSPSNLTAIGSRLFFTATNPAVSAVPGLYVYDATAGVNPLQRLANFVVPAGGVAELRRAGSTLYFANTDAAGDRELWKSDGTPGTTGPVRNINLAGSSNPTALTDVNGTLFFVANDGTGPAIWKSNGTSGGTTKVSGNVTVNPPSSFQALTSAGGRLYFRATDAARGAELWRTNSTGDGIELVDDINKGAAAGSGPESLTPVGNTLFFVANDGTHGKELWKLRLDVPGALPQMVKEILSGAGTPTTGFPASLTNVNGTLFFVADPGTRTPVLWRSDGTDTNTVPVTGTTSAPFSPQHLTSVNGFLYFTAPVAGSSVPRNDFWRSDGTAAGTLRIVDFPLANNGLRVDVLDREGDGLVTAGDRTSAIQPATTMPQPLSAFTRRAPVRVDVTAAIREALAQGKTRVTFRLSLVSVNQGDALVVLSGSPLTGLDVQLENGLVRADLFDERGAPIQRAVSLIDLRAREAGTYYLRVYDAGPTPHTVPVTFTLDVNAPAAGFVHPTLDRDSLQGGDGNDVLIGNEAGDRMFGQLGRDAFIADRLVVGTVAQSPEVHDLEAGEILERTFADAELIVESQRDVAPLDSVVTIPDANLRLAVARALGLPITTSPTGASLVQEPILASDLATLTELDADGRNITDLTGLEFATNLRRLNLAGNAALRDLAPLVPGVRKFREREGDLGLHHIEYLALDRTDVGSTNLPQLAALTTLRGLSLDFDVFPTLDLDFDPATTTESFAALTELQFLSLDHAQLTDGPVFGQSLARGLTAPRGMVFRRDGALFVADADARAVKRFDPVTGTFVDFALLGVAAAPANVAVSPGGDLYVTVPELGVVYTYSGQTGLLTDFRVLPGSPWDVAVDVAGNVFVTNRSGGVVYRRLTGGDYSQFTANGLLTTPTGLAFGPDGNLYVAEQDGRRISRFDGTTGEARPAQGKPGATFLDGLGVVDDLAFGPSGLLFLAVETSAGTKEIQRFDTRSGQLVPGVFTLGPAALDAWLTFGPEGALYVSYPSAVRAIDVLAGSGASALDAIRDAVGLRALSLTDNRLSDAGPLGRLTALQFLYLDHNRITDAGTLAGRSVIDDGDPGYSETGAGWFGSVRDVFAFRSDYRFHAPGGASPLAQAIWEFTDLVPGATYDIQASWPAAETHATNAAFTIAWRADGGSLAVERVATVNERFAPGGPTVGGRPWQSLGSVVAQANTLVVSLSDAADGIVAADAVRLVQTTPLPQLARLTLEANPLGSTALTFHTPALAARDAAEPGFTFSYDDDASAPVLGSINPIDGHSLALALDGTNYVGISNTPSLDIRRTITLEAWIRPAGNSDGSLAFPAGKIWMPVVHKGDADVNGKFRTYAVWLGSDGKLEVDVADDNGTLEFLTTSDTPIAGRGNQWTHVAAVIDRDSRTVTLYVHDLNGKQLGATARLTTSSRDTATTTEALAIGHTPVVAFAGYTNFQGAVDDVRVWNTARTQTQIEADLRTRLAGDETGLVGYWRFDESSGGVVNNQTKFSNTGFVQGTGVNAGSHVEGVQPVGYVVVPTVGGSDASASGAIRFDGVDDVVVSPNLETAFRNGDTVTLEIWFNAQAPGVIVDERAGANPDSPPNFRDAQIEVLPSGQVRVGVRVSASVIPSVSVGTVTFNTWHHVVMRYDASTGRLDGFLDGVRSTDFVTVNRQIPGDLGLPQHYYMLGVADNVNLGGTGAYFKGQLDDFRVWNVARSDPDIVANKDRRLSGTESGLLLYWKLDELGGDLALDSSAAARHGTLGSGVAARRPVRVGGMLGATDTDGDPVVLTGAGTGGVDVSVVGNRLLLTPSAGFAGTAPITITAHDGPGVPVDRRGRAQTRVDFTRGATVIYGAAVTQPGVDGITLFLDANNNRILDQGEFWTLTDAGADYALRVGTAPATSTVVQLALDGWRPTTGTVQVGTTGRLVGTRPVTILTGGQVIQSVTFANLHVADAGADRRVNEGSQIAFTGIRTDPDTTNGSSFDLAWVAQNPAGVQVAAGSGTSFAFTPMDNGTYRVLFRVTDQNDGNRLYEDPVSVFVDNVAPAFEAGANVTLAEGAPLTRSFPFSDPSTVDGWTATIDYGDGTPSAITGFMTQGTVSLAHVYADNGAYQVRVRIADDDGGATEDTFTATVGNVAPTVGAGPDLARPEGTPISLTASVVDPGSGDTHTFAWTVTASNGQVIAPSTEPTLTFTPTDQGTYTATVTVTDDDGASATDTVVVTVTNVAPTVGLSGAATVNEGQAYELTLGPVIDPGNDTVSQYVVRWGDGTTDTLTPAAVAAANRQLGHAYADGTVSRTISVDLVDEDGTHAGAGSLPISVQNVAPVLAGLTRSATTLDENGTLTLSGAFTDPGLLDAHTVRILWGDGTPEQAVALGVGPRDFTVAHQYRDDTPSGTPSDVYAITVRVSDGAVESAALATAIGVANAAPTFVGLSLSATSVTEGATLTLNGDVNDAGTLDTHGVSVDWGDGTPLQAVVLGAGDTFSVSHVYSVPGSYQLVTTATDDDGGLVRDTRTVVISDLAPVIAPLSLGTVSEGSVLTRTGSVSDASGPEDALTVTASYDGRPPVPLIVGPDGSFTLHALFPNASPHTVTVTATDRFGQSDTETFSVDVTNVAPVVSAGPDLFVPVGTTFTRTITFTDPGADAWTAMVDFGDGTPQQRLEPLTRHEFDITHSYATRAARTVTVTVTDGEASGVGRFLVSAENEAPVLGTVANQAVVLTHALQIAMAVTDTDAPQQTLSFALGAGAPTGATVDPATGVFRWTPGLTQRPGARPITVRVTDSGTPALFDEQTFTVTVLPDLDVDGNGTAGAVDGQIITRYLSGTPDAQLLTGVTLGPGATRTAAGAIRSYLDAGWTLAPRMLDADGNGTVSALTDGRLISRYLSGATGTALTGGSVIGAGATRTTAPAIAAYLDGFRPAVPVIPQSAELVLASAPAESAPTAADPQAGNPIVVDPAAGPSMLPGVTPPPTQLTTSSGDVSAPRAFATVLEYDAAADWSGSWLGAREGYSPRAASSSRAWLKRFLLELGQDDPNDGMEVVMAGSAAVDDSLASQPNR
jgi:ELWxxDGT repeat protein